MCSNAAPATTGAMGSEVRLGAHSVSGLRVAVPSIRPSRQTSGRSSPRSASSARRPCATPALRVSRARRSLTLVYDPGSPSHFLLEAFTPKELGLDARLPSTA